MISIVICTKNRSQNLKKYLPSILNQTYKDFEVIILDNGSTDDTKDVIREFRKEHKNIRYIYYPNPNFAVFRQYAWNQARGEIITSIDDDCMVKDNFLFQIKKTFGAQKDTGIVGGNIINVGFTGNARWKGLGYLDNYGYYHVAKARNKATIFGSTNLSIKKSFFIKVGGFDPLFYVLEEADLCSKVRKAGYKLVYNPKIIVKHFYTPKTPQNNSFLYGLRYRMLTEKLRFYLFLKYCYKNTPFAFAKLLNQELFLLLVELYHNNCKSIFRYLQSKRSKQEVYKVSKNEQKQPFIKRCVTVILTNLSIILSRFVYFKVFIFYLKKRKVI